VPESAHAYRAEPYSYREVRALADELGLSDPIAVTLVRRGYRSAEAARTFLAADESHPPSAFRSMGEVVEAVLATVRGGARVAVHGDFDVDGVCATAILVGALRELGAECDWLIPDRIADGYGLTAANVERLAARGTSLLITVDCGVTAVEEVALARSLGMEVVVTDHHQPGGELPDCPLLHPALDGYPFEHLCGTAVAWKLAAALREEAGLAVDPDADLDLVALATVADVVPLVGENRALVRRGLEEARRLRRPGLRALLEAARCEPTSLDESDLSFRLAPRINAAGRLYRADAGVELFLTNDESRSAAIAAELNRANGERRATEREVADAAEGARRDLPEQLRDCAGLVLAGEGWHPGVIGIVASRVAERHHRPVVVVSLESDGSGRGSGRSIPGFDLLAALEACSEHLERFGGHRAAAGLQLRPGAHDAFREAFAAHAEAVLSPEDLVRTERIDAFVGGAGLDLDLAEELERLAPFGMGNPGVRLLAPSARIRDVRTMGEGKHCRFSLFSGGHKALGVAFGRSGIKAAESEEPVDVSLRLDVNRWNGSVEPQVVLRELYSVEQVCKCPGEEWWGRFERELRLPLEPAVGPNLETAGDREILRGHGSAAASIAELLSSGVEVLAVCADTSRRATLAGLARFSDRFERAACDRCGGAVVDDLRTPAVTDYLALERAPSLVREFSHLALVDPPPSAQHERLVTCPVDGWEEGGAHPGYLHEAWEETEVTAALAALEEQLARRPILIAAFRDLREAGEASGERLQEALRGSGPHPRGPEVAARCFRILDELGLVQGAPDGGSGTVGVVSSGGTDLERSAAFRAYGARHQEALQYLERRNRT
jgi:single-stranded-DNA-specific exonuclease